jgi:hypothetical protein
MRHLIYFVMQSLIYQYQEVAYQPIEVRDQCHCCYVEMMGQKYHTQVTSKPVSCNDRKLDKNERASSHSTRQSSPLAITLIGYVWVSIQQHLTSLHVIVETTALW